MGGGDDGVRTRDLRGAARCGQGGVQGSPPRREPGSQPRCPNTEVLSLLRVAVFLLAPASPSTDADRELVRKWRARLTELDQLQADSRVSLSEGSLGDLGRVAFVFEQLGGFPRSLLDRHDKELVYSAVLGQPAEEFEGNLPAIVNYLRLTLEAARVLPWARARQPVFGPRRGFETLTRIASRVTEFRYRQLSSLRSGSILAPQVLTKANLGALGDPATLRQLETAFREGELQYVKQNDLAAYILIAAAMVLGVAAAVLICKRLPQRY